MKLTKQNWNDLLQALNFTEIKNTNGSNCYDVLNDKGIPSFQYDGTWEEKEKLFIFLSGALYMKQHIEL